MKPLSVIVTWSRTLLPERAPSVWLAGLIAKAKAGAIGVTVGEPLVEKPPAAVAAKPSSTMDLTPDFRPGSIFTVRWTETLPADGIEMPDHLTVPSLFVPPESAETKLVLAGMGSLIVTVVAVALPMLRSVIV